MQEAENNKAIKRDDKEIAYEHNTKCKGAEKKPQKKTKALPRNWQRIDYFFELYRFDGAAEELWEMLKLALTNSEEEGKAKDRSNMIFLYEHTKELYENIYTLLCRKKAKIAIKGQ